MRVWGGSSVPQSTGKVIGLLVALHVALALMFAQFVDPNSYYVVSVLFLAIAFSQAGLIGIMAALAAQPLYVRLLETVAGLVYLFALASWALGRERGIFCGLLAMCTLIAASLLGIWRRKGVALRMIAAADRQHVDEAWQFGIRHLLAWILATAVLLKIGQSLDRHGTLGILFSYGLTYSVVSVVAPWAALGSRRTLLRSAVLVLTAALIGIAGPLYQQTVAADKILFFALSTAGEGLFLLASLGALRGCGWRLVRTENSRPQDQIQPPQTLGTSGFA
jgi:hypothetical protein